MIGALIGDFWPLILAGLGVFSAFLGFKMRGVERAKRKDAERRADTQERMRKHEADAADASDDDLADRISDRVR